MLLVLDLKRPTADPAEPVKQLLQQAQTAWGGETEVGLALGARIFGTSPRKPRQLTTMPTFRGDLLDPQQVHGDVLVQVTGASPAKVEEAAQGVLGTASVWQLRWRISGFRTDNRIEGGRGLMRNPFHFTDGFGNPDSDREVWDRTIVRADQGEPAWAVGGSYQVVRVIKFATELWDKDSVDLQERIVGRHRDGRWLDGTPSGEQPNYRADAQGKLTPLDSHVRLAAPDRRNPPPMVRRSYNYDRGDGDSGLIFSSFQRDLAGGFEAVQKRLESEALASYVLTIGGGYFFAPPPGGAWLGLALGSGPV
ncbi:Dyp-type peroxidase [Streptomyces sp. NBC_01465]|uniref:Dyp-type peroxidase n=1 Tax=Streptomyces sp. NBC_01465 TaxID=2903878 RepID=UPI002E357039|nr:Dyp-type peroxidase [Streptomyces sp. NBC_01465]